MLLIGQPKVNKVKTFLPFSKFMKRPQTKFHAHTMSESQAIRSKKSKFIIRSKFIVESNFSYNTVLSLHRYFIETTTTDIDMLLQVQLQFCNNNGFVANSGIIMLFCPLLGDWILCRLCQTRRQEVVNRGLHVCAAGLYFRAGGVRHSNLTNIP